MGCRGLLALIALTCGAPPVRAARSDTPGALISPVIAAASSPAHYVPQKNGNLNRTGCYTAVPPTDALSAPPSWRWVSDYPFDIVRAQPLIDANGDIYIATVSSARVLKFAPDGEELWRWSATHTPYENNPLAPHSNIPEVPALMGDSLYVLTQERDAVSLDLATGAEKWRTTLAEPTSLDTWSMTAGLGHVLVATTGNRTDLLSKHGWSGEARVIALDPSGAVQWKFDLAPDVPAMYNLLISLVECPAHGKVAVFSTSSGALYKLELPTGKLIWSVEGPQPTGVSTGGAIVGPDDTVYVTAVTSTGASASPDPNAHGVVSAYSLESGALKWRTDLGALNAANNAASIGPLAGADSPLRVVVAVGANPPPADSLTPASGKSGQAMPAYTIALDAADGSIVWNYTMPVWHGAAAGDYIPFHTCMPDSSANVAIDGNGVVYVPHEDGVVYGIKDANGDGAIDASEVRMFNLNNTYQASPAIAPGMLVVAPCDGLAAWVDDSWSSRER